MQCLNYSIGHPSGEKSFYKDCGHKKQKNQQLAYTFFSGLDPLNQI
jgi:hypothetical protein